MVRDPYATYEGIIRRRVPNPPDEPGDPRILVAQHLLACFKKQRQNMSDLADVSTFFTYEELCADPGACAAKIAELVPLLGDVDLSISVPVKGMYDEPLRNMNDQQIANLTDEDLRVANNVFGDSEDVFAHFGYRLRR